MYATVRSPAEIVGSNPAGGMDVCCEYCVLPGRILCDGTITRLEESYRLWCVVVCDLENPQEWGGHSPHWAATPQEKNLGCEYFLTKSTYEFRQFFSPFINALYHSSLPPLLFYSVHKLTSKFKDYNLIIRRLSSANDRLTLGTIVIFPNLLFMKMCQNSSYAGSFLFRKVCNLFHAVYPIHWILCSQRPLKGH